MRAGAFRLCQFLCRCWTILAVAAATDVSLFAGNIDSVFVDVPSGCGLVVGRAVVSGGVCGTSRCRRASFSQPADVTVTVEPFTYGVLQGTMWVHYTLDCVFWTRALTWRPQKERFWSHTPHTWWPPWTLRTLGAVYAHPLDANACQSFYTSCSAGLPRPRPQPFRAPWQQR
jgi:hypothetical protein